jgi:hypothetical protein
MHSRGKELRRKNSLRQNGQRFDQAAQGAGGQEQDDVVRPEPLADDRRGIDMWQSDRVNAACRDPGRDLLLAHLRMGRRALRRRRVNEDRLGALEGVVVPGQRLAIAPAEGVRLESHDEAPLGEVQPDGGDRAARFLV